MNIEKWYYGVNQFNKLAGNLDNVTLSKVRFQISLIFEEFSSETITAFEERDPEAFLDGLCDSLVVSFGVLQMLKANTEKLFAWSPKSKYICCRSTIDHYLTELQLRYEMLNEVANQDSVGTDEIVEKTEWFIELFLELISTITLGTQLPFDIAMTLVNENNMNKFPRIDIGYTETREGFTLTERDGHYVIKDENGKVRKPTFFVSVNLDRCVVPKFKAVIL